MPQVVLVGRQPGLPHTSSGKLARTQARGCSCPALLRDRQGAELSLYPRGRRD